MENVAPRGEGWPLSGLVQARRRQSGPPAQVRPTGHSSFPVGILVFPAAWAHLGPSPGPSPWPNSLLSLSSTWLNMSLISWF